MTSEKFASDVRSTSRAAEPKLKTASCVISWVHAWWSGWFVSSNFYNLRAIISCTEVFLNSVRKNLYFQSKYKSLVK